MSDVYITSLGSHLPGSPISNAEMESYLGYIGGVASRNRAFVLRQNKIKTRHYALDQSGTPYTSVATMATQAIQAALTHAEITAQEITLLATANTLGDFLLPGLAAHVHAELGIPPIEIASFQSVCASSLMALKHAYLQLKTGEHRVAAVAGSEFASRYFRPGFYESSDTFQTQGSIGFAEDFLRFTLSDGAGAAILEARPNTHNHALKIHWIDLRSYADRFAPCMTAGAVQQDDTWRFWGDFCSPLAAMQAGALQLRQDFSLMQAMLPVWVSHYLALIDQGKIVVDNIDHVCCHYSSHSLREAVIPMLTKAGAMIPEHKWFSNLSSKGNTGSAAIFMLLEELFTNNRLKKGEHILCHVPESGRGLNGFMLLEVV